MMAREASLPWERIEELLGQLQRASQTFDCGAIIELLKSANTGYAPNGGLEDLVWCNGQADEVADESHGEQVHRLRV
jgi:hypothetical protein